MKMNNLKNKLKMNLKKKKSTLKFDDGKEI